MAIATLIRHIAAKILEAATLFGCDSSAVNYIFGPSRRGLHPLDKLARMLAPVGVFLRVKKDIARKFQRDDLVHVFHAGLYVLEVTHPYVVLHWILHQPGPSAFTDFLVGSGVALVETN